MLSAFVVVNQDGWVLTAKHVVDQYDVLRIAKQKHRDYLSGIFRIGSEHFMTDDNPAGPSLEIRKCLQNSRSR